MQNIRKNKPDYLQCEPRTHKVNFDKWNLAVLSVERGDELKNGMMPEIKPLF